jgi:signal recognition particle subunit SEC65
MVEKVVEALFSGRDYIGNGFVVVRGFAVDIDELRSVIDEYVYVRGRGVYGSSPLYSVAYVAHSDYSNTYKVVLKAYEHVNKDRVAQLYRAIIDYINRVLGEKFSASVYIFGEYPQTVAIDVGSKSYIYISSNRPLTLYRGRRVKLVGYFTRMCIEEPVCSSIIDELREIDDIIYEYREVVYTLPKKAEKSVRKRFAEAVGLHASEDEDLRNPDDYIRTVVYGIYVKEIDGKKRLIMGSKTVGQVKRAVAKAKSLALTALQIAKEESIIHRLTS